MATKKKVQQELKFYQKLILNRYLLKVFGAEKFEDIAQYLNNTLFEQLLNDGTTRYMHEYLKMFHEKTMLSEEQLQQYDLNIVSHLNFINRNRIEKIKLKYFQYLSLLFVEYYLDMFFHQKDELLDGLNRFLNDFAKEYSDVSSIPPYVESDSNKIALWNATGSGKTLLMHINYLQYKHYAGQIGDGDTYILLTPKEGLSKQHLDDFQQSGIPASIFDKVYSRSALLNHDEIQIIENTKLSNKDGDKTIAASRFGHSNVVFVDEGHRGASGDTWYRYRNQLCQDGFSFEYSATFGQAVAASNDKNLENEYAKCIIFDYSYKYFYADGYGKDYNIINLQDDTNLAVSKIYLTACLLTFYQQKKLFLDHYDSFKPFKIENPLMIFVGSSVNAVKKIQGKTTSDVVDILSFFNEFIKDKTASVQNIKRVMEHDTGLWDSNQRDIFYNSFAYLTDLHLAYDAMFDDVLKVVFNCNTNSSLMHIENMKGIPGEISLRIGENESFGLINVGDDSELIKLCEAIGFNTGSIDFKESLFDKITHSDSKINLLIGSKKFTEGWNCWRVSTMGLMNVGKSEGSEIIQLFGRGIRLKGYQMSLMRSDAYCRKYNYNGKIPEYIHYLETLNVFGVKADYMKRFKEYLEKEGVPTAKNMPLVIEMPIIRNKKYRAKKLYSLQIKEGLDYKKNALKPILEYKPNIKVELDCYGKVQFETSGTISTTSSIKYDGKLTKSNLALLDINELFLELEKYKAEKLRYNLIITKDGIRSLLDHDDWYRLLIPKAELNINSFADYEKFKNIIVTLLKLYCDRFYNVSRSAWENDHMEYKIVDNDYENFIEHDEYLISIEDNDKNKELILFVEQLKSKIAEAKKNKQLIDFSNPQKKGTFELMSLQSSLYNPLLYVQKGEKEIVITPVALVESEKAFVMDLDSYISKNKDKFINKEVYLIRNKAKKGIGFFETSGFYPDFIMWVIEGTKQYITFIDPHGMVHERLTSEKVQLHKKIKDIEAKLNNPNVILNSIITTDSPLTSLVDYHSEEEWNDNNVFFMSNVNYIQKIFEAIK